MSERQSLGEFFIEPKSDSHSTSHLRDLDRMGQAIAKVIRQPCCENLGLPLHAAESARMNDAVAIALQIVTVRVGSFRIAATAQVQRIETEPGQHAGAGTILRVGRRADRSLARRQVAPGRIYQ